jgi:hypothetical protein
MELSVSATAQGTQVENKLVAFKGDALTLTDAEAKRLAELEAQIERSNADRGRALREINKGRLYRATYPTFEAYLKVRWDMSRSRAYQLMDFADELDLSTNVDKPKTEGAYRANKAAQKKLEKEAPQKPVNGATGPESPTDDQQSQNGSDKPEIAPGDLSLTAQQKLDLAIQQHKAKLDAQFHAAVNARVQEFLENTIMPKLQAEQAEARRVMESRKGIMDKKAFRKIVECLHSDRVIDPVLKPKYDESVRDL